jgi:hypothetical protein
MRRRVVAMLVAVFAAASFAGSVSAAPAKSAPSFRHVIVVFFENKEFGSIIGSSSAPRFNRLAKRYALMTRFHGVTHPSLPNYIAFVSGSTQGIDSNCTRCSVDARSLADTIEESGRTWKTYAEGLPSPGFTGATSGRYAKKHNPFLYFDPVLASQERRERVVPYDRFKSDLAGGSLPDFSLVIPDMCNSMHDCSVRTGDQWLSRFIDPLLKGSLLKDSVVFVTFDEGKSDVRGGGHIATLAVGPTVRRGSRYTAVNDLYGLLRTIEDAWRLPRLGKSAQAKPITGIWK